MAILELKAARAWSLEQTAKTFLITAVTIALWLKRVDEQGEDGRWRIAPPAKLSTIAAVLGRSVDRTARVSAA